MISEVTVVKRLYDFATCISIFPQLWAIVINPTYNPLAKNAVPYGRTVPFLRELSTVTRCT